MERTWGALETVTIASGGGGHCQGRVKKWLKRVWEWSGLEMVWTGFGVRLKKVWKWSGHSLDGVWSWSGEGLEVIWTGFASWSGEGLEVVWTWSGRCLKFV